MARIARLKMKGEPAVYHVISSFFSSWGNCIPDALDS